MRREALWKQIALLDEMDKKLELQLKTGKKPIKVDYSDGRRQSWSQYSQEHMMLKQMEQEIPRRLLMCKGRLWIPPLKVIFLQ